jgi:hypothetical protein
LASVDQMNWIGLPVFSSAARVSDQATSSAVNGDPSCQVTPSRTVIMILVLSSFQPHSVSRPGAGDRSGCCRMNWSKTDW